MANGNENGTGVPDEAACAAETAGLAYVSDTEPGLRRRRRGKGFSYIDAEGKALRDRKVLDRIRSLVIPPAWKDVWVCGSPTGHIQATGRDIRGRKQYIYHPQWREVRDSAKYEHMLDFAAALPRIRARLREDVTRRGISREKVLAAVVQLLDMTLIRVGNKDYAEQNDSFGLTTLRDRHAVIDGAELRFEFKGKSGKTWRLKLRDRRIARVVKDCQEIPGQHLFQYFDDDGKRRPVTSSDVNSYLREISDTEVTAKDFRTWAGTVLAATVLCELPPIEGDAEAKRNVRFAIKKVAARLGNTPAICRKCYVHPELLECYFEGTLAKKIAARVRAGSVSEQLDPEEAAVLSLLRQRLKRCGPELLAAA
ncbi:MAG: DNA topoisomerase IB [Propylenella sp.]